MTQITNVLKGVTETPVRNWTPFLVAPLGERGDLPRALTTFEGMGDRLRSAAFAEIQAREAFLWAADRFEAEAPAGLVQAWRALAKEEDKHMNWLLNRMEELKIPVQDRQVSLHLWVSLTACQNAREFAFYMASAEQRGRTAGLRFYKDLIAKDRVTAEIFGKIAEEELSHIELVHRFFQA